MLCVQGPVEIDASTRFDFGVGSRRDGRVGEAVQGAKFIVFAISAPLAYRVHVDINGYLQPPCVVMRTAFIKWEISEFRYLTTGHVENQQ